VPVQQELTPYPDPAVKASPGDRSGRLVSCEHLTRRVTRTHRVRRVHHGADGPFPGQATERAEGRRGHETRWLGGAARNLLFMTAGRSVYSVYVSAHGC